MYKVISFLSNFELEPKFALLILIIIASIYTGITSLELLETYEPCETYGNRNDGHGLCGDYGTRIVNLYAWTPENFLDEPKVIVTYFLLYYSKLILGDARIFPLMSSVILIFIMYFFTRDLTKSNFAGLIAAGYLIISPIFFKYDATITYPSFWTTFLIGSLYLTRKAWFSSAIVYGLSIPSKVLSLLYFPGMIVFVWLSDIPKKNKKKLIISFCILMGTAIIASFFIPQLHGLVNFSFQPFEFLWWLGMWSIELSGDRVTLYLVYLSLFALFLLRSAKVPNASAILFLIILSIIQPAIISGFTEYTNEEYRFLPLVVFVGISLAMIIINSDKILYEIFRFQNMFARQKK